MAKTIEFKFGETTYTLEFTRKTVERLEEQGFSAEACATKPMTMLPMLFRGSFYANHRNIKEATVDMIYKKLKNKDELYDKLIEMYMYPIETLMDEPEGDEGNIEWGANW